MTARGPGNPQQPGTTNAGINNDTVRLTRTTGSRDITYDFDPVAMVVVIKGFIDFMADAEVNGVH